MDRLLVFCLFLVLLASASAVLADDDPTGSVLVTVSDADGSPVAGAVISSVGVSDVVTDSLGQVRIDGIRVGEREVRAVKGGYRLTAVTVLIVEGQLAQVEIVLEPVVIALREVVLASGYSIGNPGESTSGTTLDRETISRIPAFGEDIYRSVAALPGTSSSDLSSRFNVRGGLDRENLVLLDGLELFDPFHLQDFQGVFSVVDPGMLRGVQLVTGGMPVEFGDRSAGVLSLESVEPTAKQTELGVSFSNLWARNQGTFQNGKGGWAVSGRRGFLDLVLELAGDDGGGEGEGEGDSAPSPEYWDFFGKVRLEASPTNIWTINVLGAGDSLVSMENEANEIEDNDTRYGNRYLWANNRRVAGGGSVFLESTFYAGRVDRDRRIFEQEFDDIAEARDERTLDLYGLSHKGVWETSNRNSVKWGFGARRYQADYNYRNDLEIVSAIADVRFAEPVGMFTFDQNFEGTTWFAFASDRFQTGRLTTELGLRFDRDFLEEDLIAPRVNLVFDGGTAGEFKFGAGRYYQSQRPNELDVPDGETTFFESEAVDGVFAGWNKELPGGYGLRAEVYQRETDNPRPRYDNLFSPWNTFPEAATDRIRVAPDRSRSRGLELLLVSPGRGKWDWWASYTWSESIDEIGGRDQPRWFDQPHAVRANVNYKPNPRWNFNALFSWHTGWPTTPVSAVSEPDGQGGLRIVPVIAEFYSERLSDYHRMDLRISRVVPRRKGSLRFYLDLQNAYNNANPRGIEYPDSAFMLQPDGSVNVVGQQEDWLGLLPSFGFNWTF